jgi:hypothetical protein
MNKTQMLSETENLLYCKGKNTIYNETGISYLIQQLATTNSRKWKTPVSSPCFISGDSFTINTLQLHKYIKDYLI